MPDGTSLRLRRITEQRHPFFIAADDGLYAGPLAGLSTVAVFREILNAAEPDAIICTSGFARRFLSDCLTSRRILLATVGAPDNLGRRLAGQKVDDLIAAGADAIALHVSICCPEEVDTVATGARLVTQAHRRGFPVLVAAYARNGEPTLDERCRAVRLALEIGADVIKTAFPRESDVDALFSAGAGIPVLLGGGEASAESHTRAMCELVARGPAGLGICFGRRIFQAADPCRAAIMARRTLRGSTS